MYSRGLKFVAQFIASSMGVINGAISGEINEALNLDRLKALKDWKSPKPTSSLRQAPGDFLFPTVCENDLTFQAFRVIYRKTCWQVVEAKKCKNFRRVNHSTKTPPNPLFYWASAVF